MTDPTRAALAEAWWRGRRATLDLPMPQSTGPELVARCEADIAALLRAPQAERPTTNPESTGTADIEADRIRHLQWGSQEQRRRAQETADLLTDFEHCRELLRTDMTFQPSDAPLPDLPKYVGPVAFLLYAALQELRNFRRAQASRSASSLPQKHRCAKCGRQWEGDAFGAEYCGDCHRAALAGSSLPEGREGLIKELRHFAATLGIGALAERERGGPNEASLKRAHDLMREAADALSSPAVERMPPQGMHVEVSKEWCEKMAQAEAECGDVSVGPPPSARPPATCATDQLGWLIEDAQGQYWDGRRADSFTRKHDEAVRFSRFEDAERVRCWLVKSGQHFRSVQHAWVQPPSGDPGQ